MKHLLLIWGLIVLSTSYIVLGAQLGAFSSDLTPTHILEPQRTQPSDLPDPGEPKTEPIGPGGPWIYGPYPYDCGRIAAGKYYDVASGAYNLRMENIDFEIGSKACNRSFCWGTTAIWVCNALDSPQTIDGFHVGWMADRILRLCCDIHCGQSGQMYHFLDMWNVIIGYANCNDPVITGPVYGGNGQGNNGACYAFGKC